MNKSEYLLGTLFGVKIYVNLNGTQQRISVDLNNIRQETKEAIKKSKSPKTSMEFFMTENKYVVELEEYQRLIALEHSVLKNRSVNDNIFLKYLLQSLIIPELKEHCKSFKIKGYSGLNKQELIEFLVDSLSEEERFEFIEEIEIEILSLECAKALQIISGKSKEKIESKKMKDEENNGLEIRFSAFNYDIVSYLEINEKNISDPDRDCDCLCGSSNGFCSHFWVGFIYLLKLKKFNIYSWRLTQIPSQIKMILKI